LQWLVGHPWWSTVVFNVSKLVRLLFCTLMSGVSVENLDLIIDMIYHDAARNPLAFFLSKALKILWSCFTKLGQSLPGGILAWFGAAVDCFVSTFFDTVDIFFVTWKYLARFLAWAVKFVFTKFQREGWGNFISVVLTCLGDLDKTCLLSALKSSSEEIKVEVEKQQETQKSEGQDFLIDFNSLIFYFVLAAVPSTLLVNFYTGALNTATFGVYGYAADTISGIVQRQLSLRKAPSMLDAFYLLIRLGSLYHLASALAAELYGWFVDVFGCALRNLAFRFGFVETPPDPICCFASEVTKLKQRQSARDAENARIEVEKQDALKKVEETRQELVEDRVKAKALEDAVVKAEQIKKTAIEEFHRDRYKKEWFGGALSSWDKVTAQAIEQAEKAKLAALEASNSLKELENKVKRAEEVYAKLQASDPRLKVKLEDTVMTLNKVAVHRYRWNRSNRAKGLWKSTGFTFPVSSADGSESFLSVSAYDVQTIYPKAVQEVGPHKIMFLIVEELPTDLRRLLNQEANPTFDVSMNHHD
jgi:hypothetical protein